VRNIDKIDHVVVLMLENRSFDSMFGYLYEEDAPKNFVGGGEAKFDGVAGRNIANPAPDGSPVAAAKAPFETQLDMCSPYPDPGEEYCPHINMQLYGTDTPSSDAVKNPPPMNGFVIDYERQINKANIGKKKVTADEYRLVMDSFTPNAVPIVSGIARAYAISDRWFASVPSQTFCNRSFLHSAQSNGFVHNEPMTKWVGNVAPTIFERLLENKKEWRIYFDEEEMVPVTVGLHRHLLPHLGSSRVRHIDHFRADCERGNLPEYTFIEPRLFINHNDQHPPAALRPNVDSSVLAGELLINQVYEAVCANKKTREKTLLVILWDEHGGLHDHAPPPVGAKPPSGEAGEHGFGFDRFGVRVGAMFVSPYIEEGTVFRAPNDEPPLDHTTLIRFLCERWNLAGLTERDKNAPSLEPLLSRATPREDVPTFTPRAYVPTPTPFARSLPLTDHQQHIVELVSAALTEPVPAFVRDIGEALDHLARAHRRSTGFWGFLKRLFG